MLNASQRSNMGERMFVGGSSVKKALTAANKNWGTRPKTNHGAWSIGIVEGGILG